MLRFAAADGHPRLEDCHLAAWLLGTPATIAFSFPPSSA